MTKRAIIYTRVSTDEQNNGYSPVDQKEKLHRYCENNGIDVVGFYHDDESGKSFNRPAWKKIMEFIQKNKNLVDYIYFLKWDRFSRNAPEAYAELGKLKKLHVEARAMEQPLDLEIPEQKVMLAIYLTAPEVDNDRRALNIFNGIRRGKKDGRWLGACPRGYRNTRDDKNRPIIAPEGGLQEDLVKQAFKAFSTGMYGMEELRHKLAKKGLTCCKNSFWRLLRHKAYIGKVMVPAYKNEPEVWIEGKHPAIIDEATFYKVQDILASRRKKAPLKYRFVRPEFPLRGYLICAQCNKTLTGSFSTNRSGRSYPYYHCSRGCHERHNANLVNQAFIDMLSKFQFKTSTLKLFASIVKEKMTKNDQDSKAQIKIINQAIEKQQERISNAKSLMLDAEITPNEYKEMRIAMEEKITQLTCELSNIHVGMQHVGKKVDNIVELLSNIANTYRDRDTVTKQHIVCSIFPGKLMYEEKTCRTLEVNKVIPLIASMDKAFIEDKKRKHTNFGVLSRGVEPVGVEPTSG